MMASGLFSIPLSATTFPGSELFPRTDPAFSSLLVLPSSTAFTPLSQHHTPKEESPLCYWRIEGFSIGPWRPKGRGLLLLLFIHSGCSCCNLSCCWCGRPGPEGLQVSTCSPSKFKRSPATWKQREAKVRTNNNYYFPLTAEITCNQTDQ